MPRIPRPRNEPSPPELILPTYVDFTDLSVLSPPPSDYVLPTVNMQDYVDILRVANDPDVNGFTIVGQPRVSPGEPIVSEPLSSNEFIINQWDAVTPMRRVPGVQLRTPTVIAPKRKNRRVGCQYCKKRVYVNRGEKCDCDWTKQFGARTIYL